MLLLEKFGIPIEETDRQFMPDASPSRCNGPRLPQLSGSHAEVGSDTVQLDIAFASGYKYSPQWIVVLQTRAGQNKAHQHQIP